MGQAGSAAHERDDEGKGVKQGVGLGFLGGEAGVIGAAAVAAAELGGA